MFKKINCDSYLFEKIMIRKNIFYLKKTLL